MGFKKKGRKNLNNPYQRYRIKAGLTQEKAIEHLPFGLRTLQSYEAGNTQPTYSNVCKMAALYGCSTDAFAEDMDSDPSKNLEEEPCTDLK